MDWNRFNWDTLFVFITSADNTLLVNRLQTYEAWRHELRYSFPVPFGGAVWRNCDLKYQHRLWNGTRLLDRVRSKPVGH